MMLHRLSRPRPLRFMLLLIATAVTVGCKSEDAPIRIGLAGTFNDSSTVAILHGAELAVDDINARGGIDGRRIELVKRNDYGDPDSAVRIANELYDSDVVAVIGHSYSGPTLAASPVYNSGSRPVIQISPSASSPALSEAGPYTFRVCPSDLAHGTALAQWVRGDLGLAQGVVLYANNGYGRGIRETFVSEFTRLNGTTLSMDPFLGDPPEVAPYLERIAKNQEAQFIILAGYENDALAVLRAARVWDVTVPILGGDGLEQVGRFGSISDGTYMTGVYSTTIDTPANRAFVARYQDRFPTGTEANQSAAGAWDALHLLAELIRDVGPDREKLRDALARVGSERPAYQGLTRQIAFDSEGDLQTEEVFVAMYRDGATILMENQ